MTTRWTWSTFVKGSSRTGWNRVPGPNDDNVLDAACHHHDRASISKVLDMGKSTIHTGRRRRPLGPAMMRGFLKFRLICLRNRWKYWAEVVGYVTCILTLA